jgi:hypothetical protein
MAVKLSSAFTTGLLVGKPLRALLDDMVLQIYTAPIPSSADHAVTGTLLTSITKNSGSVTAGTYSTAQEITVVFTSTYNYYYDLMIDEVHYIGSFEAGFGGAARASIMAGLINSDMGCPVVALTGGTGTMYLRSKIRNKPFRCWLNGDPYNDCSSSVGWTITNNGTGSANIVNTGLFGPYLIEGPNSDYAYRLASGATTGAGNNSMINSYVNFSSTTYNFDFAVLHNTLGTVANEDYFAVVATDSSCKLAMRFATDGLFIYNGSTWNEVGTNLVETGKVQYWSFWVTDTTPASATVDVYLNGELKASAFDCSYNGSYTPDMSFKQYGTTTANCNTDLLYCCVSPRALLGGSLSMGIAPVVLNTLNLAVTKIQAPGGSWVEPRGGVVQTQGDSIVALRKSGAETWSGNPVATGEAAYFRFVTSVDNNESDVVLKQFPRIQGRIGLDASYEMIRNSLTITIGTPETIANAQIIIPSGNDIGVLPKW